METATDEPQIVCGFRMSLDFHDLLFFKVSSKVHVVYSVLKLWLSLFPYQTTLTSDIMLLDKDTEAAKKGWKHSSKIEFDRYHNMQQVQKTF